jgi:hypothetical protein
MNLAQLLSLSLYIALSHDTEKEMKVESQMKKQQQQGQRKEYKKKTAHLHSTHLQLFFLIKYFPFYLHAFLQFSLCVAIISSFFCNL